MQLDKTRITIRERSYVDILDLALRVIRTYAGPLLVAGAVGVVPLMLANSWLLADLQEADFELGFPARHMILMTLLIFLEMPLATALVTLYLGQALFTPQPQPRVIAKEFRESLVQLLVYQVLLRVLFVAWPYLSEVILLDRNPMRRTGANVNTTLSRSRTLHRGEGGDLFAHWLGSVSLGGLLLGSICLSIYLVRSMLLGEWTWDVNRPMYTFYYPIALWLVIGFFTVVRFLCYLDLRIRREGWEVELAMRAEQARLMRQLR